VIILLLLLFKYICCICYLSYHYALLFNFFSCMTGMHCIYHIYVAQYFECVCVCMYVYVCVCACMRVCVCILSCVWLGYFLDQCANTSIMLLQKMPVAGKI
jgi:hypothetical protein